LDIKIQVPQSFVTTHNLPTGDTGRLGIYVGVKEFMRAYQKVVDALT